MKKNISHFQIHLWNVISNMNRDYAKLNSHAHICEYILDTNIFQISKQLILWDLRSSFSLADNRMDLWCFFMMTSSNGSIFRVTGHLCEEFTGPGLVNSTHKGQWRGALMFPLMCAWINGWVNNRKTGDLRRHRAHYDVIVMCKLLKKIVSSCWNCRH